MKAVVSIAVVLLAGCALRTAPHESAEQKVEIVRLTSDRDPLVLHTFEFTPVRSSSDVLTYIEVRFRVVTDGAFAAKEITVPIIQGTDAALWRSERFTVRLPVYLLEGKSRDTWIDGRGESHTTLGLPFDFDELLRRANQPAQTTPGSSAPLRV